MVIRLVPIIPDPAQVAAVLGSAWLDLVSPPPPTARPDRFLEGYQAFHLGRFDTACPYRDSSQSASWHRGFDAARQFPN